MNKGGSRFACEYRKHLTTRSPSGKPDESDNQMAYPRVRPKVHAGMSRIMEDKKMAKYIENLEEQQVREKHYLRNQVTIASEQRKNQNNRS